jgi:predicted ATPase
MYLKSLEIDNLRCFEREQLNFQHPSNVSNAFGGNHPKDLRLKNINLLLGDNGTGKTAILSAIALAILSPIIESAGYVPYHLIRQGKRAARVSAELILHKQDIGASMTEAYRIERLETQIVKKKDYELLKAENQTEPIWEGIYDDQSPAFLLLGYGATRRVEVADSFDKVRLQKRRRVRYQRVAGLFEDHIGLTPLEAWLPHIKTHVPSRYEEVLSLFEKFTPFDTRLTEEIFDGEILFEQHGVKVPFHALSDGYRAYLGWVSDLLSHLVAVCPEEMNLIDLSGIVLVDEIDLHLHPSWQREVASAVSLALPKMQFLLTTHSPIVTGTLSEKNIFVMEADSVGAAQNPDRAGQSLLRSTGALPRSSKVRQLEETVYGKSAEEVLLSSYFNLDSTRAPEFEDELDEIKKRAWSGDESAAVEYLKRLTHSAMPQD